MEKLIDKLSSYNIFNYLLPGVLFGAIGERLTSYSLMHENIIIGAFVYYFYGLIISRIGSLFIEPLFKSARILRFAPYSEFIRASKIDQKIELLSETNNMYRTMSSLFLCLLLLALYESVGKAYPIISKNTPTIAACFLLVLFVLSYRKQTAYIKARTAQALQENNTDEQGRV